MAFRSPSAPLPLFLSINSVWELKLLSSKYRATSGISTLRKNIHASDSVELSVFH